MNFGIGYRVLKQLVFEALKESPGTQFIRIISDVEKLAALHDVFPTEEECREHQINYKFYNEKKLNPIDWLNVNQIIWDLIVDRVLTMGKDCSNNEWPWLRLTEFGHSVVEEKIPSYYDPDGYIKTVESFVPKLDPVIKQYISEGLHAFRQQLFFASAVMFGAASEKAILLLLESIGKAESDKARKNKILELLERPRLPKIYNTIQTTLDTLIKNRVIPYSVHEGCKEHLLSLFEMIRVQRNDSIHPAAGKVNRTKVFLTIQSMPIALEVIYRLIKWFKKNKI